MRRRHCRGCYLRPVPAMSLWPTARSARRWSNAASRTTSARGELHGPYYYRFTRDKYGRLRKQYVRRSEVEVWRELCERRREWLAERVAIRALCRSVVTRGGRVNWAVCFALEAAADMMTQAVTPGGGLRRGMITAVRHACAFWDASKPETISV